MTTRAIPRVGFKMRQALMAAVTAPDVLKLLEKAEGPSPELLAIIKQLQKLVKAKPVEGKEPPSLEGIYKSLKALKEKVGPVAAAIKMLDKVYGKKVDPTGKLSDLGNLPFFELLRSQPAPGAQAAPGVPMARPALQAAVGGKPGTYLARLIKAGIALDKKNWNAPALQAAVSAGMFEGVPLKVFSYGGEYGPVEYHLPLTDSDFAGSTVGNQVGFVTNATWDDKEQAVFGDICITDPARQALVDAMLSKGINPPGLSIYCEGDMDDAMDISSIARVHSMDLVTWPAAEGAILGVQALQASWLGVLGAADNMEQTPAQPQGEQQEVAPVEGAEPTANESVTTGSWKTERNTLLDFFQSMANFVREQIEAGEMIDPAGVGQAYDKWTGAWEASQDATFEEFMAGFWGNPENAAFLKKQEVQQEAQPEQEGAPQQEQQPQAQQQELNLPSKQPAGASATGGTRVMINGQRQANLEQRLSRMETRVNIVDSEAMVDQKLSASGLPSDVQDVIRSEFAGVPMSEKAVDGLVDSHRQAVSTLEASLASEAAVSIEGQALSGGADAKSAMEQILGRNR